LIHGMPRLGPPPKYLDDPTIEQIWF